MKKIHSWSLILIFFCSFQIDAQTEAYFDRFYAAQPQIRFGGRTYCIAVNPNSDDEIVTSTQTAGLLKTTDHAATWHNIFSLPNHYITFVQFAPMNTHNIIATAMDDYSALGDKGGIWLSRDGGETWARPDGSVPSHASGTNRYEAYCIASYPGSHRIIAGTNMGICISDDDGVSWHFGSVPGISVYAVALLRGNNMVAATSYGIYYSPSYGGVWSLERTGIGNADGYNSFFVPKQFLDDVTTANPIFVTTRLGLVEFSSNAGQNWTRVDTLPAGDADGANGTHFVRMARHGSDGLELYVSNKLSIWRKFCRKLGPDYTYDYSRGWELVGDHHTDMSDLALNHSGDPYLLGCDGGVQNYWHDLFGDNFSFDGGGGSRNGYAGLQVTEVTGTYINSRHEYDMYFATQDNSLFSSENTGRDWGNEVCCEGFGLEHTPVAEHEEDADMTFVSCSGCGINFSNRLFHDVRGAILPGVSDSGRSISSLKYVTPNNYISFMYKDGRDPIDGGSVSTDFFLTQNYTAPDHTPGYGLIASIPNIVPRGLPRITGTAPYFVLFQAYKSNSDPGTDIGSSSRIQRVKPMRMQLTSLGSEEHGFYWSCMPEYPANRNLGGIGVFPTEFDWYEVYTVDPGNPQHIIAADAVNSRMVQTFNGGNDWTEMNVLSRLVTDGHTLFFNKGRLTNVSNIAFDPDDSRLVLLGTRQSGIFYSWNNGLDWVKIPRSEMITEVSSFYFQNHNTVWVSSYGRGIWKLEFSYRAPRPSIPDICINNNCSTLFHPELANTIFHTQGGAGTFPFDQAMMVSGGSISSMHINNGVIDEVRYTPNSSVIWYTDAAKNNASFKYGPDDNKAINRSTGDNRIDELLKKGMIITGLLVKDNKLVDIVYTQKTIDFPGIPKKIPYQAIGEKEQNPDKKTFFFISSPTTQNGYCLVKPGDKIILRGKGFSTTSKNSPLISIDGILLTNMKPVPLSKDGAFKTSMIIRETLGYHSISISQQLDNQQNIMETDEFIVTNSDNEQQRSSVGDKKESKPVNTDEKDRKQIDQNQNDRKSNNTDKIPDRNEPAPKKVVITDKDKELASLSQSLKTLNEQKSSLLKQLSDKEAELNKTPNMKNGNLSKEIQDLKIQLDKTNQVIADTQKKIKNLDQ